MRLLNRIIVHYSWTPPDYDIGVGEIRQWHTDPNRQGGPFKDIGYHFVIRRNGQVETGRPVEEQGAHARGENHDSIGICLVGGKYSFNFGRVQLLSLESLIRILTVLYGNMEVMGHRDVANTGCPGFNIKEWWR